LEDQAARLGGILTSVESDDVDLGQFTVFLKKHGAKPLKATEEGVSPLAGMMAMGDQSAVEDEANAKIIQAFKKNVHIWTDYLGKLTGTTWRADPGELTVDFNEAFGKKRSIGVYWDIDVGSDNVVFYVEGPRGTGTQIFQRKTTVTPSKPGAPKEFFGWLEKTLQEAVASRS
jgi:hypothetical protein